MKQILGLLMIFIFCTSCSLLNGFFTRRDIESQPKTEEVVPEPVHTRQTVKSLEEQSMLGENTGSLWVPRGQSSYLFATNNRRLMGDLINVSIEGYPKEQIQTKVSVISKLLSQILEDEKQELRELQDQIRQKQGPTKVDPKAPQEQQPVQNRGLASVPKDMDEKEKEAYLKSMAELEQQQKDNAKRLKRIGVEEEEMEELKTAKEFAIKLVPTRIMEIHRNGNYVIRGEKPFMIGRREYKLLVKGMIRPEDYKDEGVSAEVILDPTFDVISEKRVDKL